MKAVNLYSKIDIEKISAEQIKKELSYIYKLIQNLTDRFNLMREESIVLNSKLNIAIPNLDKSINPEI